MRSLLLLFAMWVVLATSASAGAQTEWSRSSPPGEVFHVTVPKQMERRETLEAQPWGEQHAVIFATAYGFGSYAVVYSDLPPALIVKATPERVLIAQQKNLVPATRSHIVRQKPIRTNGGPGREVEFLSDGGRQLTVARIFLIGSRVWTVAASTRRPGLPQDDIWKFLDSFLIR